MPLTQVTDLVQAIRSLQLLSQQQMDALVRQQAAFPDARRMAKKLVDLKWLTTYQAKLLLNNQGRDLVLGQYVLIDKLGEGGMGQVFKARQQRMGRLVALKVIRKEKLKKPDILRRFEREVRLAAQLVHPNVVATLDADTVGETHVMVMEFVDGVNLSVLVKQSGPLPVAQACDFIRQAASGLSHAHEKGVIHRDIKPSNLFVTRPRPQSSGVGGVVKILDMGLARIGEGEEGSDSANDLTVEGQVIGTPDYIAPEQMIDARSVDLRADLYSLGCTFYFLLTGSPPFPGGSLGEKLLKHQLRFPTAIDQFRRDVPPTVSEIVQRLMAKRPEDRFQTAAEVVAVLSGSAVPPPTTAPIAVIVPDGMAQADAAPGAIPLDAFPTVPVSGGSSTVASGRHLPRPADRRWLWLGVGAGMGLALVVAGVLAMALQLFPPDSSSETRPSTPPPTSSAPVRPTR